MSKAVLISIRPKWARKIVNGKKTIEVRKTRPKLETPFKVYIYCTYTTHQKDLLELHNADGTIHRVNGKVIGEFICDRIYDLAPLNHAPDDVEQQACLTREEIVKYLKGVGYGWRISGLRVYETPWTLTEFRRPCLNDLYCETCAMYGGNNGTCGNESLHIKRPPQDWCYVEEK